jgi:peptidoglycan/LPS O-acetylase OafA/YrhL
MAADGTSSYFQALTGLRGIAAAWVLVFHAWQFAGAPALRIAAIGIDFTPLAQCGYFGVDLFFVLSGFLLGMPFHRAAAEGRTSPSLARFWMHRCRRVLPAYWVQLAILGAACFLLDRVQLLVPKNLIAQALLVQNLVPWPVTQLNVVYWTMPIEWDFYVVLPLLAILLKRCRWWLALAAVLVWVIAFRMLCVQTLTDPALAHWLDYGSVQQLPARGDQFFMGVLAAWIYVYRPLWLSRPWVWLLAGAAGVFAMVWAVAPRGNFLVRVDTPYLYFHYSLVAISFAALVLGAACGTRLALRLWANPAVTFLGLVSYSLYLWHYPLLQATQALGWLNGARLPAWLVVVFLSVPAVLLVSWLSYRFVERPFLATSSPARPGR